MERKRRGGERRIASLEREIASPRAGIASQHERLVAEAPSARRAEHLSDAAELETALEPRARDC